MPAPDRDNCLDPTQAIARTRPARETIGSANICSAISVRQTKSVRQYRFGKYLFVKYRFVNIGSSISVRQISVRQYRFGKYRFVNIGSSISVQQSGVPWVFAFRLGPHLPKPRNSSSRFSLLRFPLTTNANRVPAWQVQARRGHTHVCWILLQCQGFRFRFCSASANVRVLVLVGNRKCEGLGSARQAQMLGFRFWSASANARV